MNRQYCYLLVVLLLAVSAQLAATESTYNILFIQSYTSQTPWHNELNSGLIKGFRENGIKASITTEYLDADFWPFNSEKVIMSSFCQRARDRKTDLIITSSDEAFYTLFASGDSLAYQVPVVFFGIKYPDRNLIDSLNNVCGYTATPDFCAILKEAAKIFPQRKEVICVIDNSHLSGKGRSDLGKKWEKFHKHNPDYSMQIFNTQHETTSHIISAICYPRNSFRRIVIVPKWSPFLSFVSKNSKAPVFACQNVSLMNGVLATYDAEAYASAVLVAKKASKVLKGFAPKKLGVEEVKQGFLFDYKQLDYFQIDTDRVSSLGVIVNQTSWEKYKLFFILIYPISLALLIGSVIWLMRINRREAKRRMHVQTRLLVQNRLVEQRNEFDNVFHSIRDGVITYDMDLHIHFTNRSLLQMLHLPCEAGGRYYEGMLVESLFNIYYEGKSIFRKLLKQVDESGKSVLIPSGSFMKETHSEHYFPVSGEIVPIYTKGVISGMALSARNVSEEEMQKRYFDMAVDESAIYPWQFDIKNNNFIFTQGFLTHFGFGEDVSTISTDEMDDLIHPDDLRETKTLFRRALGGEVSNIRLNFRQRNAKGKYEWWEYRFSVISGLTGDSLYSILGVCQSIQRYKNSELKMIEARDKALQADKLKSAFLANMSHEIRTPLNAIVGFSDLLSDAGSFTEEEIAQFIEIINKNCRLLLALINDILDLSRIESGTMDFMFANHNLSLLLKTVFDSQRLNMPPGVELRLFMPDSEKKYLVTDYVRLQQVINNLINNAVKFTSSGSITFGYEEDEIPGYTRIFVEDTGLGISKEGISHIFERFYKVDNFTQGAGLGLSICQTIVERLNGKITVTSEVGQGTRFLVRIPNYCE